MVNCDRCVLLVEHLIDRQNPERYSFDVTDDKLHLSSQSTVRNWQTLELPSETPRTAYNVIREYGGSRAVFTHYGTLERLSASGTTCRLCRMISASWIFEDGVKTYEINIGTRDIDDLIFDIWPTEGPDAANLIDGDRYYLYLKHSSAEDTMPDSALSPERGRIWGRQVHERSDSDTCRKLAAKWYKECKSHNHCNRRHDAVLPTRVINVSHQEHDSVSSVRLVASAGSHGSYAALSYCWGDSLPLRLTKDTFKMFLENISFSILPKTFRDAVSATRALGLRYLWIDALCIIQDDPEDISREVELMSSVFGDCELVLSASLSQNCQGGLYSTRDVAEVECSLPRTSLFHSVGEIFVGRYHRAVHLPSQPVDRRAWTFQERLLCPAVLHFLPGGMIWECRTKCECENGESQSIDTDTLLKALPWLFSGGLWTYKRLSLWIELVHKYSSREMTYKSDRLPAIAGLAKYLSENKYKNTRYLAGLWESELPWNLVWKRTSVEPSSDEIGQLPSWTWAAVQGGVSYSTFPAEDGSNEQIYYTEAKCVETPTGKSGNFGHVRGGKLTLTGPLQETSYESTTKSLEKANFHGGIEVFLDRDVDSTRCWCLLIRCLPGMALDQGDKKTWVADSLMLSEIEAEHYLFRRFGVVRHFIRSEERPVTTGLFKSPFTQTISVV